MNNPSSRKLNRLQQLPEGVLVDAAWLERHGYSSSLRSQYVKAGWLNQPAPRVYRRGNGALRWQHAVLSLQQLLADPLLVGGRTALEELGYAHYLGEQREVHLYGPNAKLPSWVHSLPIHVAFHAHNSLRLFPAEPQRVPSTDAPSASWELEMASAEMAVLQLLDELPHRESFHQVDKLVEGLTSLSPRRLQPLLETCRSVKVKRLFFFFADRHRHAWRDALDKSTIDLGTGKRMLVKGGTLDPTYLITIPGDLDGVS